MAPFRVLLQLSFLAASGYAFQCSKLKARDASSLSMVPKYDKKTSKWAPSSPSEGPEAGYGIGKTLLLRGPKPFLHRVFQPDDYEQAVLKCESRHRGGPVFAGPTD
jgi:hypothetical protein